MSADWLTQESWRIAEELGDPVSEPVKLWETVRDELSRTHISSIPKAMSGAVLMKRWKETKNPYFVDAAVCVCNAEGVEPTEAMVKEMTAVSLIRMKGSLAGTPDKVRKAGLLDKLLLLMMNLVVSDFPLHAAARKAQQWQRDNAGVDHFKASTLEKRYTELMRNSGIERHFIASVNKWGNWHKPTWKKIGEAMPETPKDESGERR